MLWMQLHLRGFNLIWFFFFFFISYINAQRKIYKLLWEESWTKECPTKGINIMFKLSHCSLGRNSRPSTEHLGLGAPWGGLRYYIQYRRQLLFLESWKLESILRVKNCFTNIALPSFINLTFLVTKAKKFKRPSNILNHLYIQKFLTKRHNSLLI